MEYARIEPAQDTTDLATDSAEQGHVRRRLVPNVDELAGGGSTWHEGRGYVLATGNRTHIDIAYIEAEDEWYDLDDNGVWRNTIPSDSDSNKGPNSRRDRRRQKQAIRTVQTPTVLSIPTTTMAVTAPLTGSLNGIPPTTFTGDRGKSEQFLREFRQYRRNNRTHELITNPFSRVGLALSYIRGPVVNDWVDARDRDLETATTRTTNPIAETDEVLWTAFEEAFKNAWTDTLSKQNAYQKLMTLAMTNDDIDNYIASFERLAHTAGWDENAQGTIEFFRRGLKRGLLLACLRRPTIPDTMSEWKVATREESQRYHTIASCIGGFGNKQPKTRPTQSTKVTTHRNNDPVSTDVDTVATTTPNQPQYGAKRTPEEVEKCKKEGRCFRCLQQGHLSKNCPKKGTPTPLQVNATETVPTPANKAEINVVAVHDAILKLGRAARQNLISSLLLESDVEGYEGEDINAMESTSQNTLTLRNAETQSGISRRRALARLSGTPSLRS